MLNHIEHQEHTTPIIILVADHEPDIATLCQASLPSKKFKIKHLIDGRKALQLARETVPDLIFLNIDSPEVGLATCAAFKSDSLFSKVPVILATNQHSEQRKLRGFAAGASDYLVKPVYPQELVARAIAHFEHLEITRQEAQNPHNWAASFVGENPETSPILRLRHANLVQQACELMLHYLQQSLTLEQLAKQLGSNRNTLNSAFQTSLGISPMTWLREERLRSACCDLKSSRSLLKTIAISYGYSSQASFSSAFKKQFGLSPSQYRQKFINLA